ncbi:galactokinase [Treponema parvum]|uniref:galactokinase n=1 Tax=Treponema parvum TaxID=138851 RepID=UPI001AEC21D5|nr:galactokinase [Treponema parvum]QTQ16911.1 galactokinase [Treponema parvum]
MKDTDNEFNPSLLKKEFVKIYGGKENEVRIFSAPARINIIGEHIDYNGGKVLPAAIDKYLYVAVRLRPDTRVSYRDLKFPGLFDFDINDKFVFKKENDYANYLNGVLSVLKRKSGLIKSGFDALIASDIPPAGGISSSSALECGFAYAVNCLFNLNISRTDIALAGQESEHEFMNVKCGIMDQFIISTAKKDTAEFLDCATLEFEYVPLKLGDYVFVVMNTNKKRQLADSKYNERRSQCEAGLKTLQEAGIEIPNLCALSYAEFEKCAGIIKDPVIFSRVRHCVTENERVLEAVKAFKTGDLHNVGELLKASHKSLKEDYEVTGIELDTLTEAANAQEGCIGSRMTGAGFGGCAIALVSKDKTPSFVEAVQKAYTAVTGYDAGFFVCTPGDGVKEITDAL